VYIHASKGDLPQAVEPPVVPPAPAAAPHTVQVGESGSLFT
jgi:hypothetical protein